MNFNNPQLKGFFRNLIHQSIRSGIFAAFFKMPLPLILGILAALIGAVVFFQLY